MEVQVVVLIKFNCLTAPSYFPRETFPLLALFENFTHCKERPTLATLQLFRKQFLWFPER